MVVRNKYTCSISSIYRLVKKGQGLGEGKKELTFKRCRTIPREQTQKVCMKRGHWEKLSGMTAVGEAGLGIGGRLGVVYPHSFQGEL